MPTIPTDLRARIEAALTAAGQMTPGPLVLRRFVDGTGNDAAAVVHEASGETVATCDNEDRSDEARPVCDAAGIVALRNAVPDLRALLALLNASQPPMPYVDRDAWHAAYLEGFERRGACTFSAPEEREVARMTFAKRRSLLDAPAGLTDPTMAVARIEAALTEHGLTSCGDGACIVRLTRATGQQTNGGCQHLRNGLVETRETLQRMAVALRALATQPAPLTVGAALADPRAQDGSHVVEYVYGRTAKWWQLGRDGVRQLGGAGWVRLGVATVWIDTYALPCRLVPLADADQDPGTRGAL